ncbi:MAG: hypothetical protein ABI867_37770 [Kofleriaceae bacterium]
MELGEAVIAWRAARHAVLADAVDALAARGAQTAIVGRSKEAYQKAWLAVAKRADSAAITALAAGLTRSVPVKQTSILVAERDAKRYRAFLDRIAALAELPADPRIAAALVALVERALRRAVRVAERYRLSDLGRERRGVARRAREARAGAPAGRPVRHDPDRG